MSKNEKQSTKKRAGRMTRGAALATAAVILVMSISVALADYVGTGSVQISLDPASVPTIAGGLSVGDEVSFILQQAPKDVGHTYGMVAYGTVYVPDGVVVSNAELVALSGGIYSAIPASPVRDSYNTCGPRGCRFPSTESPGTEDGKINEVQSDTGIFYSTDSRTALVAAGYGDVDPTGTDVTPQKTYNEWDFDQVKAFGEDPSLVQTASKEGQGNTPLVPDGENWIGTGSPVAGPLTYYKNDYKPDRDGAAGTYSVADLGGVGPWQRIKYANAQMGGSGDVTPAVAGEADSDIMNNAVSTTAGFDFSGAATLPAGTNALRYVFGARTLGDIELARVTFKITDVAAFQQSIDDGDFCMDGTGGDTDNSINVGGNKDAPKDNPWRYYESNNHTCYDGEGNAGIIKTPELVNGAAAGSKVKQGDIIGYEVTFINETTLTLYDIDLVDTRVDNKIKLVPANTAGCTYPNYDGDLAGSPTFLSLTDSTATWNRLDELASGQSVTVHLCAEVLVDTDGDEVLNKGCAMYAAEDASNDRFEVCDLTLQLTDTSIPTAVSLASLDVAQTTTPAAGIAASLLALLSLTVFVIRRKTAA